MLGPLLVYAIKKGTKGGSKSITSASSTFQALTGTKFWLKATAKTHIRFGPASGTAIGTCVVSDIYLTADQDYVLDLPTQPWGFVCRTASGSATIHWQPVG